MAKFESKVTVKGSCHCQSVKFEIRSTFPELTTCDCSICQRKNALMIRVHESDFTLLEGKDSLSEYRFHTETARHFFCAICGIYPFHRKRLMPDSYGVNIYCLDNFDSTDITIRATDGIGLD